MAELDIPDDQADRLLTVLRHNEGAVQPEEAVRWDEDSASLIGDLRETVETQLE